MESECAMGTFLNRGIEEFRMAVNSQIYVDKTEMIVEFNKLINTEQAYVCVSRPRRFGKTMAANMLAAYFEKGSDARFLFEDRKLGQCKDWDKNLNKYDVIRIDVAGICTNYKTPEEALDYIEKSIIAETLELYDVDDIMKCDSVCNTLDVVNQKYGAKFIIIIDEWDVFFRDEKSNNELQTRYIKLLYSLFKGNRSKKFTAFAYITGILPIKKYDCEYIFALNNFREYTMLSPKKLAQYVGFTDKEVEELCTEYGSDYNELCDWYDGYRFDKFEHIFGPNSVVHAILGRKCNNYWSQTVAFNSLSSYITMNFDGLRENIVEMIGGGRKRVRVRTYENDMVSFRSKDDVMTLLIHLGYLVYDSETEEAYIPNREVMLSFEDTMQDTGWTEVIEALNDSEKLLRNLLKGNAEAVAEGVEKCHRENTSILKYNDENALSSVIGLAFYHARTKYKLIREFPSGEGFADIVFVPKHGVEAPAIVIELKYEDSTECAIAQIKDRKYPESLESISGEIILVAISYDKDGDNKKKHHCIIERYEK